MCDPISKVQAIIDLWPSLADFAADAAVELGAAKQMRRRGSIPSVHWASIIAGAKRRKLDGATFESLGLAHSKSSDPGDSPLDPARIASSPAAVPANLGGDR